MRIQAASSVPIFQQIADGIRAAVAAGVYRPGDLIPSVRAQAIDLVVNPNTVQRAYELLEREGLIEVRKGTGTLVAAGATDVARNGSGGAVRATFVQGILQGNAAGMSRAAVDRAYREAWDGVATDLASSPAAERRKQP
jgi:DNA-binding transcriptional regulator YhcF (GntR family)